MNTNGVIPRCNCNCNANEDAFQILHGALDVRVRVQNVCVCVSIFIAENLMYTGVERYVYILFLQYVYPVTMKPIKIHSRKSQNQIR